MAGQAWAKDEPIFVCDLQSTKNPDVRPNASQVDVSAAVAIPVHDGQGRVRAVVGFAFTTVRDFDAAELEVLERIAEALPDSN